MLATFLVDPNEIPSAQQRRDRCVEEIMIWAKQIVIDYSHKN